MTLRRRQNLYLALLVVGALLVPTLVTAQMPPPLDLPGERPAEIPIPEEQAPILPSTPPEPIPAIPTMRIRVDEIRVVGNSVLPAADLEHAVEPYVARELTTFDLDRLRDDLTRLYIDKGFLTSGATLPDQDFEAGVLVVQIVEGRIETLRIEGNERFRDAYLRPRILPDPDRPVDVNALETRLQRLQRSPQIDSVHAELRPGLRRGESILRVRIIESRRPGISFDFSNHRSPALGEAFGGIGFDFQNITGWGDELDLRGQFGEGLQDFVSTYAVPLNSRDTRMTLGFRWAESEVVEHPFDDLDIESRFVSTGIEIEHPVWRTLRDEVSLGLRAEWRRGRNYVDGHGFSFSEGADEGESTVVPLRPFVSWVRREANQVLALRAQVSFGLPILDATDVSGAREDAHFVTGLVQGQWARRFAKLRDSELVARFDLQVSDSPLLPIEQFSVGGHASVRGYRENERVSDNGFDLSLDLRLPLWRRPDGRHILQVVPFVDVGRSWDDGDRRDSRGDTLASLGAGLRWMPIRALRAELFWGHQLRHVSGPDGDTLQDDGVQFLVTGAL